MRSIRSPVFQGLLKARCPLRHQQRRWAQVHDVRFLATHHDRSHIIEKYKAKLDKKAKEEGHESIESLQAAYKEKIEKLRREAATVATPEPAPSSTTAPDSKSPFPAPPPPPQASPAVKAAAEATKPTSQTPGIRPLSSYLDIEKILTLPNKEIEALWRLRNANNPNSICACIPLETYRRIAEAARQHPQFILPLPRQQTQQVPGEDGKPVETAVGGADIHFLQWGFHPPASPPPSNAPSQTANTHASTIVFTHLAAYKLHGSFAEPHTTITHHLDLADEKGLVLMHGQVLPDKGVSPAEASWLVSCVQRFYDFGGEASGRKGELLKMFTSGDVEHFKVEELMEEAEKIS
ncbi:putative F1F0 ATP synthase assembly protein Atp11 [Paecilomyces variotii]|uniref:Putative F1F0 ATP synthase assembly protein Atp11 n=1 Tax=Byssochlamys spectabilis TaxID=264951 RepID=A0A443I716_BYSSP|nr:putative F1F0 ATP synthase assembly protein Atp11 [Paecilomyces variotii]KAJ9264728.1 hypothetical protein DTO195F2_2179 [Paecilomyces variotii]KAJ9356318.1 hypothetical protein DTO280E4_6144 [Paecilomyces variotii]RWQ99899.1 putative F1F0 ATP synthase assembly protein Atp11 [Paecilomyces variotii]